MFNLKNHIKEAQKPCEKYLREESVGGKADESQPITEKAFPDRDKDLETTTEAQLSDKQVNADNDTQIIEKVLNEATSNYVEHRAAEDDLSVPPINTLVEQIRQKRMDSWKTTKESNWTVSFDDKAQNGDLPAWKKIPAQHEKPVLNNCPDRFTEKSVKDLVGSITTAELNQVAQLVKTGSSYDYDNAIVAILEKANSEQRDLTTVERNAISDIKIARTNALLQK